MGNLDGFYRVYPNQRYCFATITRSGKTVLSAVCDDKRFQRRDDAYRLLATVFDLRRNVRFSDVFCHDFSFGAMVVR